MYIVRLIPFNDNVNYSMMNKPFLHGLLAAAALTLTACTDSTSDTMEVDEALNLNPNASDSESYSGRVMDGYLQNALVWLDLNDNNLLDEGEPSARTQAGGQFTLDLSRVNDERRAADERILDPRNYPLMVIAIPGETVEEAGEEGQVAPISKGFFMMAPAGSSLVSPLTTLVKIQRDLTYPNSSRTDSEKVNTYTKNAHNTVREYLGKPGNFLSNYQIAKNQQYASYAKSAAEMIRRNFPDTYDLALRQGVYGVINSDVTKQLGRLTLSKVSELWTRIDELAVVEGGLDYSRVNVLTDLSYPLVALDFSNPYLLKSETTFKNPESVDGEDLLPLSDNGQAVNISSDVQYVYNENSELLNIVVDGYKDFDAVAKYGYSPLSFLVGTDMFQFWGSDQKADQVFFYKTQGAAFTEINVDTRHVLDYLPELSKPEAKSQMTDQPDTYVLDGVADREAKFQVVQGKIISSTVKDINENYALQYFYDELDRLLSIKKSVGGQLTEQTDYVYDYTRSLRDAEIHVAVRTDRYRISNDVKELEYSTEYYSKEFTIQNQSVEQIYQVFITDNRRTDYSKYMIWDLDLYDPIELVKDFKVPTPRVLLSSKEEDVLLAQELIQSRAEQQLEGKIRKANLYVATTQGQINARFGALATFGAVKYNYQRLSDFVFGLEAN